jgi:hypothetical protein
MSQISRPSHLSILIAAMIGLGIFFLGESLNAAEQRSREPISLGASLDSLHLTGMSRAACCLTRCFDFRL